MIIVPQLQYIKIITSHYSAEPYSITIHIPKFIRLATFQYYILMYYLCSLRFGYHKDDGGHSIKVQITAPCFMLRPERSGM